MKIRLGIFLDITRAPRDEPALRESDIASTATERLPEFEEGVADVEARHRRSISLRAREGRGRPPYYWEPPETPGAQR